MSVLICQDIEQRLHWDRELLAAGVTHLLVPIFSKPVLDLKWEQDASTHPVMDLGAWTVVSNSLIVGNAVREERREPPQAIGTCLVAGPGSVERTEHGDCTVTIGYATKGTDVGAAKDKEIAVQAAVFDSDWIR